MRTPIRIEPVPADELEALEQLYHQTKDVRVHERVQMVLLSVEQRLTAAQIAAIVRSSEQTVRTWLKRFQAEGAAGLADKPRPGAPPKTTPVYRQRLVEVVRQRPRSLGQPYSLWTLQRLADYMADESGIRQSPGRLIGHIACDSVSEDCLHDNPLAIQCRSQIHIGRGDSQFSQIRSPERSGG
jgi:transposase